jgi:hypothetical protein
MSLPARKVSLNRGAGREFLRVEGLSRGFCENTTETDETERDGAPV